MLLKMVGSTKSFREKSRLSRHIPERELEQVIVANADQILIVASLKKPDFRNGVVDRLLVAGLRGDLELILILNKTDLGSEAEFLSIRDLTMIWATELWESAQSKGLELKKSEGL